MLDIYTRLPAKRGCRSYALGSLFKFQTLNLDRSAVCICREICRANVAVRRPWWFLISLHSKQCKARNFCCCVESTILLLRLFYGVINLLSNTDRLDASLQRSNLPVNVPHVTILLARRTTRPKETFSSS